MTLQSMKCTPTSETLCEHHSYQALRKPRTDCLTCWMKWSAHLLGYAPEVVGFAPKVPVVADFQQQVNAQN